LACPWNAFGIEERLVMSGFSDWAAGLRPADRRVASVIVITGIVTALMGTSIGIASGAPSESSLITKNSAAQVEATAVSEPIPLAQCIQKSWLHSMEEDTEEIIVYRPEGYPFPPARGRIGFEFLAGGYLIYHGFGPADEPLLQHGRWEQPGQSRIVISIDEPGKLTFEETWHVNVCNEDRLEIARLV
jgi:hypothetical protein